MTLTLLTMLAGATLGGGLAAGFTAVVVVAAQRARRRGVECSTAAREGDPAEVLVDLAERHGADVLVIGNRGMQRRVLGSVPNTITHKARCSVFVVKTT